MEIVRIDRGQKEKDYTPTLWLQGCTEDCQKEAWNGGCYYNELFYEGVYNVYYEANKEEDPQE